VTAPGRTHRVLHLTDLHLTGSGFREYEESA